MLGGGLKKTPSTKDCGRNAMRLFKPILAAVICASISGCASTENYEKILQSWIGADADRLVSAWGPPDSVYELSGGGKVLQWVNRRTVTTGGHTTYQPVTTYNSGTTSAYGSYGGSAYGMYSGTSTTYVPTTTPVRMYNMRCATRFTVSEYNIIQSWTWEGNSCKA